ncbi:MAG: folate family ECF transporter S component [Ruminococcus sp.]|nr:folate family ECF transporter S component [Ruminococcus sp.]
MKKTENNSQTNKRRIFGTTKKLVVCALFVAMSIVLGKFLSIKIGDNIRISFENLSLIMSGMFFGPVVGLVTAAVADIVGCILYGYAINPIITLGAASIGFTAGLASHIMLKNNKLLNVIVSVSLAHLIGSIIIKTIGLYVYYHTPFQVLIWRLPVYIITAAAESFIIYTLVRNKAFSEQIERMNQK